MLPLSSTPTTVNTPVFPFNGVSPATPAGGIVEDASAPATVTTDTLLTVTTAAFNPPAQSLILALVVCDGSATAGAATITITDSGSNSWSNLTTSAVSAPGVGGCAQASCFYTPTALSGYTVTATATAPGTSNKGVLLTVKVLTGAATASIQFRGAFASAGGASINPSLPITTKQQGSIVYGSIIDFTTNAVLTPNGVTSVITQHQNTTQAETYASFRVTNATVAAGAVTSGFTNAAAGYNLQLTEILPAVLPLRPLVVGQAAKRAALF
ncbi:MAG: hypothetical protein JWL97_3544 [Gemmatimonadales bacterium]|nr:hypothetical protein [Gemmatimonadales bacterium]